MEVPSIPERACSGPGAEEPVGFCRGIQSRPWMKMKNARPQFKGSASKRFKSQCTKVAHDRVINSQSEARGKWCVQHQHRNVFCW